MLRVLVLTAAAAIAVLSAAAHGQDAPKPADLELRGSIAQVLTIASSKLSVTQALQMLTALRGLDGRQVAVKNAGQDAVILQAWEFSNGLLRLAIAQNIAVLSVVEQNDEKIRTSIVREVFKGEAAKEGTPEMAEFVRQLNDARNAPVLGVEQLKRIAAKDLKLERNEIPSSILAALVPILDQ